ncbi:MAG: CARDB domain-containing protein, partial [Vicinamibacterales bacterium]
TITYGSGSGWLQATLSGTTAPATLTVQPTTGSLPAGTHTATVPITSGVATNSPQTVTVTFTVAAPSPVIGLSASALTYGATEGGANPSSQVVNVTNSGGGTLSGLAVGTITYGSGSGWLQGTLSGTTAPATLTVQPTTGSLAAGTYTATVPITSGVATNSPQTVTVTFTMASPSPTIGLSASALTYGATQGGANPSSQVVNVTNGGGGTLSGLAVGTITYGSGSGWLQATLSGTTAPATLTVQPTTGSLAAGTYTATVPITSGVATNSPQTVTVTFTVASPSPAIGLGATAIPFWATQGGANPSFSAITVRNTGGGVLSDIRVGTVTYGPGGNGWLNASRLTGTVAFGTGGVTLQVFPQTGTLPPGTYTATIPVESSVANNSPQNLTVTLTLTAGPGCARSGAPTIALGQTLSGSISSSDCVPTTGGRADPWWFNVASTTDVQIDVTAAAFPIFTAELRLVDAASNVVVASGFSSGAQSARLTRRLNPGSYLIEAGSNSAAASSSYQLAVVAAPMPIPNDGLWLGTSDNGNTVSLGVRLGQVDFFYIDYGRIEDPASASVCYPTFYIGTNANIVGNAFSVSSGVTTFFTSVSGTFSGSAFASGSYGQITLNSFSCNASPWSGFLPGHSWTVSRIDYPVTAAPAVGLSGTALSFGATQGGASPASQVVDITNSGGSTLSGLGIGTITYGSGSGWLQATLSGTTAPATLTVQPTTGGLAPGTYTATVPITSGGAPNSPQDVTVTFTVAPTGGSPAIALSGTALTYGATQGGANPASQVVNVTNSGGGTLSGLAVGTITYGSGSGWLQATLSGATAPATLTVGPTTGSLAAGTYTATVPITSGVATNSPLSVTVTFTVAPPAPAISLSAPALTYGATQGGADPTSQVVNVTNSGGGSLSGLAVGTITYGSGSGWLQTALSGTTAPAILTLQPVTGSLAAGTYTATVPITSGVATNSPQTVTVTFTVASPSPMIGLSASALTYGATQGGANPASQVVNVTNSGVGTLSGLAVGTIAYGSGSGWLQATLSGTTAPATLTVQPTTGTLAAGTYTATVSVTSGVATNSPQSVTVTFTITPAPDLLPLQSGLLIPSQGIIAGTVNVQVVILNNGAAAAGAFRVGFYYSNDFTITAADVYSGSACTFASGLSAGASNTCSGAITVPASLAPGTYYIGAIVDDLGAVAEGSENNNFTSYGFTTALTGAVGPDLVPVAVTAPSSGTIGGTLTVSAAVRNQGPALAGAFRMAFYYSTDSNITTSDVYSGAACTYASGLVATTGDTCSGPIPVPGSLTPGTWFVGVIVDDLSQVSEVFENNNSLNATATSF